MGKFSVLDDDPAVPKNIGIIITITIIIINKPIAHKHQDIIGTDNFPTTHTWKT